MSKVFVITEGLENMGAMRTGGQGSVYKGRRIGEIISAVKLLPTPVQSESNDDKNFRDFQNEVQKLKKVNEEPNPNVVKILNSGITDSGSFPFIEMEFIEGPDLEELLRPPHDPIFTIKEAIKVAEQLANALAHCHKFNVRHGDIKSNNVKFNIYSGNYVLLDFGLSVMSDEQRRSSLRHAGAIEFMAPEQNDGKMLFQTDVYSFGVIVYELLAGIVPFPLMDNGETSRNNVMISHMETPAPDILPLRKIHLPETWSTEKKEKEMQVPGWLLSIVTKCLEKEPRKRFASGAELYEAISNASVAEVNKKSGAAGNILILQSENEKLQTLVKHYEKEAAARDKELVLLRGSRADDHSGTYVPAEDNQSAVKVSKPVFFALMLLLLSLAAFSAYNTFFTKSSALNSVPFAATDTADVNHTAAKKTDFSDTVSTDTSTNSVPDTANLTLVQKEIAKTLKNDAWRKKKKLAPTLTTAKNDTSAANSPSPKADPQPAPAKTERAKYKLAIDKAYFYTKPDEATRRNAFLVIWNNAELTAVDDKDGFIYVVFFTNTGQITRGWLRKKDLKQIN